MAGNASCGVVFLLGMALIGCRQSPREPVALQYAYSWNEDRPQERARLQQFTQQTGIRVTNIPIPEASREYVAEVLTRIQRSIAELNIPHEASRVASRLTLSIGAAFILPSSARTHEGLIQLADEALYSAKEQGRNRVVVMEAEYHTLRTGRFEKRRGQNAG